MAKIKFNSLRYFLGRNGTFKATALDVEGSEGRSLHLRPITSKGVLGRCEIVVPENHIVELVTTLRSLYPDKFAEDARYARAINYLCDSELSVKEQVDKILKYEGDEDVNLEGIEGVLVWEPLVGRYTVGSFIEEVLY